MNLFGIIIPFRPKSSSANWEQESKLLKQTVLSVMGQRFLGFHIYIVYTDLPIDPVKDPGISYVPFTLGTLTYEQIEHREELLKKFKSEKLVVSRWDKGRKIVFGCKQAKEGGCNYIMSLDSDDLLSNRLLEYCDGESKEKECAGWYAETGFIYQQGTGYVLQVPDKMRLINGSTHILRTNLINIPETDSADWLDYNFFTDHGWIKDRVKEKDGAELEPIPFPAVVYVVHASNISKIRKEFGYKFKKIIKRILRGKLITKKLRAEFSINPSFKSD